MKKISLFLIIIFLCLPLYSFAKTYVYNGGMSSTIQIYWERTFHTNNTRMLEIEIANPTNYKSGFNKQDIQNFVINTSIPPSEKKNRTDEFGNTFTVIKWNTPPNGKIKVQISYIAEEEVMLTAEPLTSPFPLTNIPSDVKVYLKGTDLVQKDDISIIRKAKELTQEATTEYEAVTNILNWVVDYVSYVFSPENRDALYSLRTQQGNCENYSHLACALLRSVGIPARVAGGLSVHKPWTIPTRRGRITQDNGEGRHAWLEIYYPEFGWIPHDPQQTHLFINSHLIRNAYGLDASDISERMRGAPRVPRDDEYIQPTFINDNNTFTYKNYRKPPGNYIVGGFVQLQTQNFTDDIASIPKTIDDYTSTYESIRKSMYNKPEEPKEYISSVPNWGIKKETPKILQDDIVEIGFGMGSLEEIHKEVSESSYKSNATGQITYQYVTEAGKAKEPQIYAQAFTIDKPLIVDAVYLLMHNFGGPMGKIWVELRKDNKGSPAFSGYRSRPKNFDTEGGKYIHGYSWFEFSYESVAKKTLEPGKWWIVLRHDGNAIVNWQCIWGNPYGDPDDTKSTRRMTNKWDNLVNVDFNFRVRGKFEE